MSNEDLDRVGQNESAIVGTVTRQMRDELTKRKGDVQIFQNLTVDLSSVLEDERNLRKEQQNMRENSTLMDPVERTRHLDLIQEQRDALDDAKDIIERQKDLLESSALDDITALREANKTRQQIRKLSKDIAEVITSAEEHGTMLHAL